MTIPTPQPFWKLRQGPFDAERRAAEQAGSEAASWGATFWAHAVVRTRFFDDWLLDAANQGIHHVVMLAAGLDTRAYRLAWPAGVTVYELDVPEMFAFKDDVLSAKGAIPRCERRAVSADLRHDWSPSLAAAGFDPTVRAAWLIEGLFTYLFAEESPRLLTAVGQLSVRASAVAFEYERLGTDPLRARARQSKIMTAHGAMWKGGLEEPRLARRARLAS